MNENQVKQLVERIKSLEDYNPPNLQLPITLRSFVLPWLTWDASLLEKSFSIHLPPDLKYLWDKSSGLVLFVDQTYGQWGLVIWSPEQTYFRHQRYAGIRKPGDFRNGDLIIGEFLGESDLLVIRCDPNSADFGSVLISLPLDPRDEWYRPADSLGDFLQNFIDSKSEKFWKVHRS